MDATDAKIVQALQRDGRQRLADLSETVGLSATPLARRIARLEESGVITGYSARVDQEKLGLPLNAFIFVELEHQSRDAVAAFETALRRFDEVMECYLMTGTRDVLIRVVARDLAAFDRFLEDGLMQVPGIRNMRSSFALRTMIRRDVLPM
ncbi:MAG: Lrp/AsnC family transcriptional regulator [Marinovum algicola]|jgi:Lrp/AsnC family leucine-responsive transcriptional regulator|uniref:Transcriptional regulator, AsnC family n=1 Tax=Marinovum algicola TaxID=42444 RepID=A0A975W6M7_9RHOB|nr:MULTISPECIES: Lrp/AsnC family transcriptional regulator [Marinovum]AKO96028.1 Transcriptional regulator [Marinovum algicola DG 898]MDD9739689.1 Lrp/AsnC family transcriptional regulator [Marinovum sp. SP66]SEI61966.1 transcriptional regulator, AsnC family [Marinovum algicola]SLN25805.1 Leucine-responsive regulatory protein [Marinovum algicola]